MVRVEFLIVHQILIPNFVSRRFRTITKIVYQLCHVLLSICLFVRLSAYISAASTEGVAVKSGIWYFYENLASKSKFD